MTELLGISIIIANYNYERFLAAAIDSALNQNHPLCEVIVIDDGSTDNSRAIIEGYGNRIRSIFQETNRGQMATLNTAWPLASHPILIFLDSDDLLFAHAAAAVTQRWTSDTVKIQFPLLTIDKEGRELGAASPKFPPNLDTATIREELLRTGCAPNSPGTGNAYSRSLLDRIRADGGLDLDNQRVIFIDAVLECNAPFYGEIITVYEPLGCYRTHDANETLRYTVDHGRFDKASHDFACKLHYFEQRCRIWDIPFDLAAARNRSPWALECELAAAKLGSAEARPPKPVFSAVYHAIKAYIDAPMPAAQRLVHALWFIGVATTPRQVARYLIAVRFVITQRPAWLERVIKIAYLPGSRGRRSTQTTSKTSWSS
jgi:glycosyltransferase involved in cell wall biosynthesis